MNGFDGYDVEVGSAYGIRRWHVDALGRLIAQSAGTVWTPGVNVAKCSYNHRGGYPVTGSLTINAGTKIVVYGDGEVSELAEEVAQKVPEHVVPAEGCGCGFWAYHEGAAKFGNAGLVGVIEASGRTIIGTQGIRTERAKIVALSLPATKPATKAQSASWREHWLAGVGITLAAVLSVTVGMIFGPIQNGSMWWAIPLFGPVLAYPFTLMAWLDWRRLRRRARDVAFTPMSITMRFPGEVDYPDLTPDLIDRVLENYPDVRVFPSVAAMLAEFPVSQALRPSPDTDPEFWTRPAVTS